MGRLGFSTEGEEDEAFMTGFGFCASASVMLMLCFSGLLDEEGSY